jgi:hypothetical protein
VRRLLAAVLLGVVLALGGASTAMAAPPGPDNPNGEIPSEVWAGTAVPTAGVECQVGIFNLRATLFCIQEEGAGPQVAECFGDPVNWCDGEDFATTANMTCYDAPAGWDRYVGHRVCVNSPAMKEFLAAAPPPPKPYGIDFNCGFGDALCTFQEDYAVGMLSWGLGAITWAMDATTFTTDGALWIGAASEFSWWRWAVVLVTVVAMAWGITVGLLRQDGPMVRTAVIGGILAWPAAELAVWTLGHLLNVSELLTDSVMESRGGGTFAEQLAALANAGTFDDRTAVMLTATLLALGSVVMVFVFAFRNLALMVLVAFAPLAFMLAPVRPGARVVATWAAAVLALLITKPLTIGLLALILQTGQGLESLWVPQALPLLIGIILSVFMPFVAFTLFDFVGTQAVGSAEGAGRAVGGTVARAGQSMGRSAGYQVRSRARIPAGGGRAPAPGGAPARQPAITRPTGPTGTPAPAGSGGAAPKAPTPPVTPPTPKPGG